MSQQPTCIHGQQLREVAPPAAADTLHVVDLVPPTPPPASSSDYTTAGASAVVPELQLPLPTAIADSTAGFTVVGTLGSTEKSTKIVAAAVNVSDTTHRIEDTESKTFLEKVAGSLNVRPKRRYRKKRVLFGVELDDPMTKTYANWLLHGSMYLFILVLFWMVSTSIGSATYSQAAPYWQNFKHRDAPEPAVLQIISQLGIDSWDPINTVGRRTSRALAAYAAIPTLLSVAILVLSVYATREAVRKNDPTWLKRLFILNVILTLVFFIIIISAYVDYIQGDEENAKVAQMAADLVDRVRELKNHDDAAMQQAVSKHYFGRYRRELTAAFEFVSEASWNAGNFAIVFFLCHGALLWPIYQLIKHTNRTMKEEQDVISTI